MKNTIDELIFQSRNWDEFAAKLNVQSQKIKGDSFERLTQLYLQIDPIHASKLSKIWLLSEVPASVRTLLNLRSQDQGIDLIALTKAGEYWAIQCKYRGGDKKSVALREISTFVSTAYSVCRNISFGLICTTSNRITHKLEGVQKLGICANDVWFSLDEAFFSQAHRLLRKKPVTVASREPRPHQKRTIARAKEHFLKKKQSRGKMIMACGTGKSLLGFWITKALGAKTVVVAVPSLALIKQSLDVWLHEFTAAHAKVDWICVCSDSSVAEPEKDAPVYSVAELGIPCLTDPKEITDWFKNSRPESHRIVFTTYQSGKPLSQAARSAKVTFDLGIMDEAHKTVGARDKAFSHLLFDRNIRIKKRLFMTATERRYRGDSDQILSMEHEKIYGETFELLTFKEALEIKPPILCDYRIITIDVRRSEIEELIRDKAFVRPDQGEWKRHLTAHDFAALVALRKAVKRYGIRHAISFHGSIEKAKAFKSHQDTLTKLMPSFGKLDTFHVSGALPASERKSIVQEFCDSSRSLITNARCLTEGVDIPKVDCVLFADPKHSTIDIVQAAGRALRRAEGKQLGYIVIPLLTKDKTSGDEASESGEYKEVISVLRALAANDDRIIEFFRSISGQGASKGASRHGDLVEIISSRLDAKQFVKSLELKCWSRLAKLSWRSFEEARAFVHKLKLRSNTQWRAYCRGENKSNPSRPDDIPICPFLVYADQGWNGWGDWLGTGTIAYRFKKYRSFKNARAFAKKLTLNSAKEWFAYCRGEIKGLSSKPDDIPMEPSQKYKGGGWTNWGDWLGTGTIAAGSKKYRPFFKARLFVRKLKMKSCAEWKAYCRHETKGQFRKPDDIPSNPNSTYKKREWQGWGDWLGTGSIATRSRKYRSYRKARAFVHKLKLRSGKEWFAYCRGVIKGQPPKPNDIPVSPFRTYEKAGWKGMGDWLGPWRITHKISKYQPFKQARAFVHTLKLKSKMDWFAYCQGEIKGEISKPDDIPTTPPQNYKEEGWSNWGDWLGTGKVANQCKQYRSFQKARKFVRKLELKSGGEWVSYCRNESEGKPPKPDDIPSCPSGTYKDKGWKGMGDWLGTGTIAPRLRKCLSFQKARTFVHKLGLKSRAEWLAYCQSEIKDKPPKPDHIPVYPCQTYGKEWSGWGDWLGTGRIAQQLKKYRPFKKARAFVHRLKLKSCAEWLAYSRGEIKGVLPKPEDIPTTPFQTYKNDGWKGMGDWLGTGTVATFFRKYRSFYKARAFVHKLKLRSHIQWLAYCRGDIKGKPKKPDDIPASPYERYENKGWKGWGDWLGAGWLRSKRQ